MHSEGQGMAKEIEQWLEDLELAKYVDVFAENEVGLRDLPHITEDDLKDLGLPLGPRKRLLAAVSTLGDTPPSRAQAEVPPSAQAERRQLTVLFCDLVGSTELASRLDPEDMRDALRQYHDAVTGVTTRHEGYVANYLGDGVLAYFGWPYAHEDQAAQAARAGLEMTRVVGNIMLAGSDGEALSARVGIATGQVVVGDLIGEGASQQAAVTGETPNLASRLQGVAQPGDVVIGGVTRQLLDSTFDLEDLGKRALKGISDPVPMWRVRCELPVDSRFEARTARLSRFVGRDHEVGLLQDRWQQAKAGEGQVVLLSGEPGIGKSRITQTFRDQIADEPQTRLSYQCSPYHVNTAFHPVIQQLSYAAGLTDDEPADNKLDKLEALLALASANIGNVVPLFAALLSLPYEHRYGALNHAPEQQRLLTLRALGNQLIGLAQDKPVLFLVEDAHWIDPTTQDLIADTVPRIIDRPVMMLITHRPEWSAPFLAQAQVSTLNLNRLSRTQGAELVRAIAGTYLSDEAIARIVERTDGIPLFVEELTKSLVEAGIDIEEADIPATLQGSLMARLDRLGTAKEIAQIGAVIGREFSREVLAAVAQKPTDELTTALDRLVQSQLVFQSGSSAASSYSFKHALIQDVAYDSLLRQRRRDLHLRIARALESNPGAASTQPPEVMARHYEEGGDVEHSLRWWEQAGKDAAARSAQPEAVAHFESALRLLKTLEPFPDLGRIELSLLLRLGQAQLGALGGAAPDTMATFERAAVLAAKRGSQADRCRAHYGQFVGLAISGRNVEVLAVAEEVISEAIDQNVEWMLTFGKRLSVTAHAMMGQLEKARAFGDEVMAAPHHMDQLPPGFAHDPLFTMIANLTHVNWSFGYPETALIASQKNLETIVQESRNPNTMSQALVWDLILALLCRDAGRALETVERLEAHTERTGGKFWAQLALIGQGSKDILIGAGDVGLPILREGLEGFMVTGALQGVPFFKLSEVEGLHLLGDQTAALSVLNESHEIMNRTDQRFYEPEVHRWRGKILAAIGREDEAVSAFLAAIAIAEKQSSRSWQLRATTSLAELDKALGRNAVAREKLQAIYETFDEGHDLPDLVAAKALLDQLA